MVPRGRGRSTASNRGDAKSLDPGGIAPSRLRPRSGALAAVGRLLLSAPLSRYPEATSGGWGGFVMHQETPEQAGARLLKVIAEIRALIERGRTSVT
jgi:hypothetical protein